MISDKGYDDDKLRAKMPAKGIGFIVPYRKKRAGKPFEAKREPRRYEKRRRGEERIPGSKISSGGDSPGSQLGGVQRFCPCRLHLRRVNEVLNGSLV